MRQVLLRDNNIYARYKSKLELAHFCFCDANSKVLEWAVEPFAVPYFFCGKHRRYYPDLFVRTQAGRYLIEIKYSKECALAMNQAKWAAARQVQGVEFIVSTEIAPIFASL